METVYYKEFAVLAETSNFWEASERLYINQSTLSKHIKAMEKELGVPLFHRTTRHVSLTKFGEALLPYAQSITRTEFEYSTLFMQLKDAEKGVTTLGSIPVMAQYNITGLLNAFQKEYPKSTVKIIEEDAKRLSAMLLEQRCELIFTREPKPSAEKHSPEDAPFVRIPYLTDHMVALLPAGHPLAARQEISLRELKDERFCFIKESSLMYELCTNACQAANFIPEIAFTSHRLESIFDMVSYGNQVALLMNRHITPVKNAMLPPASAWSVVDIAPRIYSQISLCYLKDKKLSETARNFVDFCVQLSKT